MPERPATHGQLERLTRCDPAEEWFIEAALRDRLTYEQAKADWENELEFRRECAAKNAESRKESLMQKNQTRHTSEESFEQAVAKFRAQGMPGGEAVRAARKEDPDRHLAYIRAANPGKVLNYLEGGK